MRTSAGLLVFRRSAGGVEVLLAHMGGPFWARKDEHAWSLPKGEYDESEEPRAAALREFEEEMGTAPPDGEILDLGSVKQSGGKVVTAFAVEGDFDPDTLRSNTFEMQWPPRSGRMQSFPEVDRAAWFDPGTARTKLVKGQIALLDRLLERLAT